MTCLKSSEKSCLEGVERSKGKGAGDEVREGSRGQIALGLTFICSFSKYLLSAYCVPGAVLGDWDYFSSLGLR